MGANFQYVCLGCGYQAEVSGGLDFGRTCATHTVCCARCRELSDTVLKTLT